VAAGTREAGNPTVDIDVCKPPGLPERFV
jgi:hypothetical protein